jgi:hypothetical protein
MAAVAVMGLEMDANLNKVCGVTGTPFSRSAIPNPSDQTSSPFSTTAAETPGTLFAAMNFEIAFSRRVLFAAGSLLSCAKPAAEQTIRTIRRHPGTLRTRLLTP